MPAYSFRRIFLRNNYRAAYTSGVSEARDWKPTSPTCQREHTRHAVFWFTAGNRSILWKEWLPKEFAVLYDWEKIILTQKAAVARTHIPITAVLFPRSALGVPCFLCCHFHNCRKPAAAPGQHHDREAFLEQIRGYRTDTASVSGLWWTPQDTRIW